MLILVKYCYNAVKEIKILALFIFILIKRHIYINKYKIQNLTKFKYLMLTLKNYKKK